MIVLKNLPLAAGVIIVAFGIMNVAGAGNLIMHATFEENPTETVRTGYSG